MAIEVHVPGATLVKVGTGSGTPPALEDVGYTVNGVDIDEQGYYIDVHGDEHGGDAGPPIDVQWVGQVHILRMVLSKFDKAIVDKIRPGLRGKVAGEVLAADIGSLILAGGFSYRVVLDAVATAYERDYLQCVFREPIVANYGTKHQICHLTAYAYRVASPASGNARIFDATIASVAIPGKPEIVDLSGESAAPPYSKSI